MDAKQWCRPPVSMPQLALHMFITVNLFVWWCWCTRSFTQCLDRMEELTRGNMLYPSPVLDIIREAPPKHVFPQSPHPLPREEIPEEKLLEWVLWVMTNVRSWVRGEVRGDALVLSAVTDWFARANTFEWLRHRLIRGTNRRLWLLMSVMSTLHCCLHYPMIVCSHGQDLQGKLSTSARECHSRQRGAQLLA